MKLLQKPEAKAAAHIKSDTTFYRCIDEQGFPPGRIVAGKRLWTEAEIEEWVLAQPSDKLPSRGRAKQLAGA